ncbi:MAG: hypothetical protein CL484_00030 [Acidobacteria bacterium]|nr:hypothetical protein [Acidobacteriota bacterium]
MDEVQGGQGDEISLQPLFKALWRYRLIFVLGGLSAVSASLLCAFWIYTTQPVERRGFVGFRVEFAGSAAGEYPNGERFSRAEIASDPVLTEVYEVNDLARYLTFEDFKRSIFVQDANSDRTLLELEYENRLSDESLNFVNRSVLETEFQERSASLQGTSYTVNMVNPGNQEVIPEILLGKVLNDILTVWTEQARRTKGAFSYLLTFQPPSFSTETAEGLDDVIRAERGRDYLNQTLDFVEELESLPGAATFQSSANPGVSVSGIRANLEETRRFVLAPLLRFIMLTRQVTTPVLRAYLDNRQLEINLDHQAALGRLEVLERSMRDYLEGWLGGQTDGRNSYPGPDLDPDAGFETQVSGVSLDRLLAMAARAGEGPDILFRQALTERIILAGEEVVDLEREVAYYRQLLELTPESGQQPQLSMSPQARRGFIEDSFQTINGAISTGLAQSRAFLRDLEYNNLQPETDLFSISTPFALVVTGAETTRIFFVFGLGGLLFACVVLPLFCLVHYYVRKDILEVGS